MTYCTARHLRQPIHIACVNSPSNVTLAGSEADIDMLKVQLDKDGIFAQKVKTGIAYHTSVMRQISSDYLSSLDRVEPASADYNATDGIVSYRPTDQSYRTLKGPVLVDNLTSPVRFIDALQYLAQAAPK